MSLRYYSRNTKQSLRCTRILELLVHVRKRHAKSQVLKNAPEASAVFHHQALVLHKGIKNEDA